MTFTLALIKLSSHETLIHGSSQPLFSYERAFLRISSSTLDIHVFINHTFVSRDIHSRFVSFVWDHSMKQALHLGFIILYILLFSWNIHSWLVSVIRSEKRLSPGCPFILWFQRVYLILFVSVSLWPVWRSIMQSKRANWNGTKWTERYCYFFLSLGI